MYERNRTQVVGFLGALGATRYSIQIKQWRADGSGIMERHSDPISSGEILARLETLAKRNCARACVFVRIVSSPPTCVMVDDLDAARLAQLRSEIIPSAVVETSPENYQAWVRIPPTGDPLTASRGLARHYDGDLGAVGASQPGRLPGLTNRKPSRANANGQGPWVRLVAATPDSPALGGDLLKMVMELGKSNHAGAGGRAEPAAAPQKERVARDIEEDQSRADMRLAVRMAAHGYCADQIVAVLMRTPEIERKSDPTYYARRTAAKAVAWVRS